MIMIAAPFAGRLTDRIGARWILVTGLLLMTGGILFITSRITLETSWRTLWPALMVTGTGMGMTFAPMTAVVMMDVPGRIAGSASGILNTTRNIGQVLGIAVLGSLLQSRMVTHTSTRLEQFDLEDQQRDQIVGLARNSRFDEVTRVLPPELSESILGGLRLAFVDSLHNTFIVSAVACFFGALAAWQIRNPARRQAPVVVPATESAVRAG
jgi:MFS family permease